MKTQLHFSPPRLHPPILKRPDHIALVTQKFEAFAAQRAATKSIKALKATDDGSPLTVPLTTVSLYGNFDSYITVNFTGGFTAQLMVDSGNSMMIVPNGEDLIASGQYTNLGDAPEGEPWGCPAVVLQGTLLVPLADGSTYEIDNCVFYACTGNNPSGYRTANFGLGCIHPWSSSGWNLPFGGDGIVMQAPLSYGTNLYTEVAFAPAQTMFSSQSEPLVTQNSQLILQQDAPSGYTVMPIIEGLEWMSLVPLSLAIEGTQTAWPNNAAAIAMIDTGGGPAFLSDPDSLVWDKNWPDSCTCPTWTSTSTNCRCVQGRLDLTLASSTAEPIYSYAIDTTPLPSSVQGLTGVFCQTNAYMMNQAGMNVGGITCLFNRLLIDYNGHQVGMMPIDPNWTKTIEMGAQVQETTQIPTPGALIGYDLYPVGATIETTMKLSWTDLPAGATLYVQHGGSSGATVLNWSGPDTSTAASGELTFSYTVQRTEGAAVPLFIYAFSSDYLSFTATVEATSTTSS